ncbi:Aldo/keto reductase [Crucibulum laeve]|uniref:Aldo/keto reductase n=1 Tax=Crucibulum laeve TaxID=68775 RepID=A0A5C3MGW7_9AGAR|nr:Aldo/keto reductase [Crucibulum laeve]
MSIVSQIIYGTAWKKEQTAGLVVNAILQGFRAIDTACQPKHYREDLVGEALTELAEKHHIKREQLFIQTKYTPISGQDTSKPLPYNPKDPIEKQIASSLQTSLSNLRTTYLDSYILHSPFSTIDQTLKAWRALMASQDEGKVRMIGVSNTYDVQTLAALHKERKVQVVQNRWYEGNEWDRAVLNFCKEHGIMYQSFWTISGSPSLLAHPALTSIAQASNLTPAQTVLKIAQMEGIIPLSGTTSELHMKEDLNLYGTEIADSAEEMNAIKAFIRSG